MSGILTVSFALTAVYAFGIGSFMAFNSWKDRDIGGFVFVGFEFIIGTICAMLAYEQPWLAI
jgi:hypothetical protein